MSTLSILNMIQQEIIRYIYPFWLVFGLIGCGLNVIVFSRPQLRKTSCCICKSPLITEILLLIIGFSLEDFLAASIDHLFTLIIGIGPAFYSLNHPDPLVTSLWFCKLRGFLFQISLMLSRWFVVSACIDRYVLTCEQVRFRNLATRKNSYRIIALWISFWLIICTHRLVFYEIEGNFCAILNNMAAALFHSLYVIIGGGILPSLIMIVCAILIRRNLLRKKARRNQMNSNENRQNSLDQQVHNILFVQITFYVIFTAPQLVNVILNAIFITMKEKSDEDRQIERFVSFIAEIMLYLFPVTSFYLYTLTSRTFRSELIKFFRLSNLIPNRIRPNVEGSTRTKY